MDKGIVLRSVVFLTLAMTVALTVSCGGPGADSSHPSSGSPTAGRPSTPAASRQQAPQTSSIDTTAGRISIGDTWDEALPKLQTGTRVGIEQPPPNEMVDLRTFAGVNYRLTFRRTESSPYTLIKSSGDWQVRRRHRVRQSYNK
jgi:hypothetical protein